MTKAQRKLRDAIARDGFDSVRRHTRMSAKTLFRILSHGTVPRLGGAHRCFIAYGVTINEWFEPVEKKDTSVQGDTAK